MLAGAACAGDDTVTVSGLLHAPDGRLVAGASVHVRACDGSSSDTAVTDAVGRFELTMARPPVEATACNYLIFAPPANAPLLRDSFSLAWIIGGADRPVPDRIPVGFTFNPVPEAVRRR